MLNVSDHTVVADFFVIATATNRTHLEALAESLKHGLNEAVHHQEGTAKSNWILVDCRDVIVHLFMPEARLFYALERLWGDAPQVPLGGAGAGA